jgi:hypothetical protein
MKGLEIHQRCGEHGYSFLSDSHSWQEALLAVWYVCRKFLQILSLDLLFMQTVLVLKYILHDYPAQFTYYGYANVSQSVALMLSVVVLWIAHNTSSEYEYNLTL